MEKNIQVTEEMKRQLREGVEHYDIVESMETLADISGKYLIGDITVQACLGHLKLLMEAGNPLVCPDASGSAIMDEKSTVQAIYILDVGQDAMYPLQRIRQKKARLEKYAELSKKNPVYIDRMESLEDDIDELEIEFENLAEQHYAKFEHLDMGEVLEGMMAITDEITEVIDRMPEAEDTGSISKKKHSAQIT